MFTGIITGTARIAKIGKFLSEQFAHSSDAPINVINQNNSKPKQPPWGDVRLVLEVIESDFDYQNSAIGASICCSGVCLTLVNKTKGTDSDNRAKIGVDSKIIGLEFDVSTETLEKTTIKNWQAGDIIHLEPSLRFGDELGGHLVAGHVDGTVEILSKKLVDSSYEIYFSLPHIGREMIVPKGSIALDGVSLTINNVQSDRFSVMIIPHTAEKTNFGKLQPGDAVNLEFDVLARYVARQMALFAGKHS